jgi:hypothetical protein
MEKKILLGVLKMLIEKDSFVYTDLIKPGTVAVLKNGTTVIGVSSELEAQWLIFKSESLPEYILDYEDKVYDLNNKLAAVVDENLLDEYSAACYDHLSLLEKRAFEAGFLAGKHKGNESSYKQAI